MGKSQGKSLNHVLAIGLTFINCLLVYHYFFGFEEVINPGDYMLLTLFLPLQMGLITYYTKPESRRPYAVATIITGLLSFLIILFYLLVEALASAWNH